MLTNYNLFTLNIFVFLILSLGANCELEIDDCNSNTCKNGGYCLNKNGEFFNICFPQ